MEVYSPILGQSMVSKRELMSLPPLVREQELHHLLTKIRQAISLPVNTWYTFTTDPKYRGNTSNVSHMANWSELSEGLRQEIRELVEWALQQPQPVAMDSGVFGMLIRQNPQPLFKRIGCKDLDGYAKAYASKVREFLAHPLADFFYIEMDVTAVRGHSYEEQKRFRYMLEQEVGVPPVPVYQGVIMPVPVWLDVLSYHSPRIAVSLSGFRVGLNELSLYSNRNKAPYAWAYLRLLYRVAKHHNKSVHLLGVLPTFRTIRQYGVVCDSCDVATFLYNQINCVPTCYFSDGHQTTQNRRSLTQVKVLRHQSAIAMVSEFMLVVSGYRMI